MIKQQQSAFTEDDWNWTKELSPCLHYKNYLIIPVYEYCNGKTDYHVYPDFGKETGFIVQYSTIERVKDMIDEILDEQNLGI